MSVSMVMLVVAGLLMILSCNVIASLALKISTVFCSVMAPSLSNLPRVLSHVIPHIIQSLMGLSHKSQNLHKRAFVFRSVRYWSMDLPTCWLRVLKMCYFHVTFL